MSDAGICARAAPEYALTLRVYWEDTDAGGVVYYANYLKFMERCRTEWLRQLGVDQHRLRAERQLQFAVVRVSVEYLRPAVLDDELRVTATLTRMSGASFSFDQTIWRNESKLAQGEARIACLDSMSLRPRSIPADILREWRIEQ